MPKWIAASALLLLIAGDSEHLRVTESPEASYTAALAHSRDGDLETSLAVVRRAARRWKDRPESAWHWRFRLLEAELLLEQNQAGGADALLDAGSQFGDRFDEVRIRRLVLNARRDVRRSEFEQAAKHIEKAEKIVIASGRMDLLPEVQLLGGQILARLLRTAEAEDAFRKARRSAEQFGDAYLEAAAATNLGLLSMIRSRCDQAIPLFEHARQVSVELGADRSVVGANNNLGMCYSNLGDFDRALEYREEALRLARPSARRADVLGEMGILYLAQEQIDKAIPFYERALEMAKQFGALPEGARWAGNLATALAMSGDLEGAEKALEEALSLKPEPRSRMHLELAMANIARQRGRSEEARTIYERTITSAPKSPELLWRSHAGLARVYRAQGKSEQANASFEAAIRVIETNRSDLNRTEHKMTFLSSLIRFYQDYVDALMAQNAPLRALEVAESSRARVLAERLSQQYESQRGRRAETLREIARESATVLLSYWLASERSFLWVVTPTEIRHFVLPPAKEISRLVTEYRAVVENSVRDPLQMQIESGRRLYEELVLPAKPLLSKQARVTIVPDGVLHYLNFETLPVYDGTPHYWIEDVTASVTPSLFVFRGQVNKPAPNATALIIGDPVPANSAYPALPHAAAEISKVSARFPSQYTRVIRGPSAEPSIYSNLKPADFDVIHIAAHAEANPQSPLDSAVILSPGPQGFKLHARTVADVALHARLVTLSACRSSGARAYGGEGLVGLAWAFMQAGSQSVVAGLWDVADESTALLMDQLYAELVSGAAPPDALRRAKLQLMRSAYAKPYYWGPFQCYVQ